MNTYIAAIAIEDRVDLRLRDGGDEFFGSLAIPEGIYGREDGSEKIKPYLHHAYDLIKELFERLFAHPEFKGTARDLFNSLAAMVVSVPGVVEDNRRLLQIPLWHSKMDDTVNFDGDQGFDFPVILSRIAADIIADEDGNVGTWGARQQERFRNSVFVVNDATAAAAFEYTKRIGQQSINRSSADFVYVKIHNGVNVGLVQSSSDGKVEVKTVHAEAGHSFPRKHSLDHGFKGACYYHNDCYEGLVAGHSFLQRVVEHPDRFSEWVNLVKEIRADRPALRGTAFDTRLVHNLLRAENASFKGIEILAHYIAQLVLQLSIGPLAPKQVVIGGQMAVAPVIDAIRQNLIIWSGGYPQRADLSPQGIDKHVVCSSASQKELTEIEVNGAFAIGIARSYQMPNSLAAPSRQIPLTAVPGWERKFKLVPKQV